MRQTDGNIPMNWTEKKVKYKMLPTKQILHDLLCFGIPETLYCVGATLQLGEKIWVYDSVQLDWAAQTALGHLNAMRIFPNGIDLYTVRGLSSDALQNYSWSRLSEVKLGRSTSMKFSLLHFTFLPIQLLRDGGVIKETQNIGLPVYFRIGCLKIYFLRILTTWGRGGWWA